MSESTGGQQPTNEPRGGETSAEAAGSIRDRLRAPADSSEANSGGDSRGSDITDASFQQTDSAVALATHGRDEGQHGAMHAPPVVHGHARHEELSEREARRAERLVASLFLLSVVGVVGFVATFFKVPFKFSEPDNIWFTPLLAVFMALALAGLGAGQVLWAKTLMTDEETVQERHDMASDTETREAAGQLILDGFQETGLPRRKLLRNTLLLGAAALPIMVVPLLLDLGPYAHKERLLRTTAWKKGVRLVRRNGTPIRLGDLAIGSLETVYPDVPGGTFLPDTPTMLIRMDAKQLIPRTGREDWSVEGHIAYSVICTHLGCPVKLYEQQTHHLFCPCHQSTFDAANGAKVLFGPAARSLPQLPIHVDDEGYFVATSGYTEPVGPSFWERS
jgi:ubiquinol-cytochrome c reductase iron-sulfur subunit